MKTKATYFHAGCSVCVEAEEVLVRSLDKDAYELEVVHLGEQKHRIPEAENAGVKSVPALVIGNKAFHINYGGSMSDVKAA